MAENTNTQHQTEAERAEFEEKYSKELSAGTYAKKQIVDLVVSFGSMLVGGLIGNYLGVRANLFKKNESISLKSKFLPKEGNHIGAFAGAMIGGITGQLIQGYGRWKKHESERLAVAEINEDVANMKIRNRTNPELVEENDRLREMLEVESQKTSSLQEQRQTPAQTLTKQGAKTPMEHSQTTQETALQV